MTGAPWRAGIDPEGTPEPGWLSAPAEVVAPRLLGARLRSTIGGQATEGVIVEVEAYLGPHDPASHAAERIGRTTRNEPMFGAPGTTYVYLIYGMHECVNVVTGEEGVPSAVLIRAIDPLAGREVMAGRRGRECDLASGPGRLCAALGITRALNGHDLSTPPLELRAGWTIPENRIGRSPRIGVTRARDWPLRFYVKGNEALSR